MNSSKESPMNEDKMVSDIERMLFLVKTLDTLIRKKTRIIVIPQIYISGVIYIAIAIGIYLQFASNLQQLDK